jgi:16S rRNA (guanine966-N2)-methyltransferase
MRVVAGKYRSRPIKAPAGRNTRPTLDQVKESMFNIIGMKVINAVVLDLFSGSGALGIEALSRGAKKVYFNDLSISAIATIKDNLKSLGVDEDYEVTKLTYKERLKSMESQVDILILDPPYKDKIYEEIITYMLEHNLLSDKAVIMIESELICEVEPPLNYQKREYKYGNKKLVYLTK